MSTSVLTADHPDVEALGLAGRELVLGLVAELAEDTLTLDVKDRTLLIEAARHLDVAARIEAELAAGALVVIGSAGQPRVSPLVDSLDKARRTTAQLLAHVAKGSRSDLVTASHRTAARRAAAPRARGAAAIPLDADVPPVAAQPALSRRERFRETPGRAPTRHN